MWGGGGGGSDGLYCAIVLERQADVTVLPRSQTL